MRSVTTIVIRLLTVTIVVGWLGSGSAFAQSAPGAAAAPVSAQAQLDAEKTAIERVIRDAYVEGIFVKADAGAVREGWHPGCDIVTLQNGGLVKMPAHNFARRFDRQPMPLDRNARAEFVSITVSGYAAVAVLELKSGDRAVYTDMMSLYRFDDGWKIVTKIYYAYPSASTAR
jgi:hypothetical protein